MSYLSTDDLATRVDDPRLVPFILDVRAPDQFTRWRIEGAANIETINIPYWTVLEELDSVAGRLPEDRDVVVVCGHGGSSGMIADLMGRPNVHNLDGGMDQWANTLVARTVWEDGAAVESDLTDASRTTRAMISFSWGLASPWDR